MSHIIYIIYTSMYLFKNIPINKYNLTFNGYYKTGVQSATTHVDI